MTVDHLCGTSIPIAGKNWIGRKLHVPLTGANTFGVIPTSLCSLPKHLARTLFVACVLFSPYRLWSQTFVITDGTTYSTCDGIFYDSGGPSGNYGNSENITCTICPAGGPNSGPLTALLFTQWNIAAGLDDRLEIFQGTTTGGAPFATGTNANSFLDQTFTSTHPTGCLTFRWSSDGTSAAAGWVSQITTGPSAGQNNSISRCSNAPAFPLFGQLNGSPDAGGTWTAPSGAAHGASFNPATDPPGVYTYTVSGPAPCPDSSATVTIAVQAAPNAGSNGSVTLCATDGATDLIDELGGTPAAGGTWTGPGGAHSGTFIPGTDVVGVYTYTLVGVPPCANASATVTVTVNAPANAGSNASATVCTSAAPFNLFGVLGGTPAAGGAWTGPGGTPVSNIFTPGTTPQGVYTYTVLGAPPCPNATATVNVTVVSASNPGEDRSITVCTDAPSFSMITQLGGTPQPGGTWVGPGGPTGGTFNPASSPAGPYTYTVQGVAPCPAVSATLTIAKQQAPNAGTNGTTTVCSTDGSFALITRLGGTPNGGGSWTAPGGTAFPGTFIPGTSVAGIYTYTVPGVPPCANRTATVTVTVNTAPNAGTNATVTRCSNAASFNLFNQLGGNPTPGGTWSGPGGANNGTFIPGTNLPGAYTYTLVGGAPCANATATVTVNITQAPVAGTNRSVSVCTNGAPFQLLDSLGGTPDPGGSWSGPGGASNGTFTPGTSTAGVYTYTVVGQSPCANATATVTVTGVAPPNPGTNGTLTVCTNALQVNLFSQLGGSPQPGGTWTRPNGTAHSGTLQPATDPAGTYTYTVQGNTPCAVASASVQVTRVAEPNAGIDATYTVCSTTAPFQLFTVLGGTPSGSGSWLSPTNAPFAGTFTPGTTPAGIYKYIVLGNPPCANDTAFVTVVVNQAPNAGTNASSTICSSQAPFNLITVLGGTPNAGGSWVGPTNQPFPGGLYTPGTTTPGAYTYTVTGLAPCLNASAVVAITEQRQPIAGTNGSFSACSSDGPVVLLDELGGTPDGGGAWTGPGGTPNAGVFLPASSPAGIYTYTVLGTAPCTNATASVNAVVNQAPDAGADAVITVCADQGTVDLSEELGGTPDAGGTWTDDDATGQLSGSLFSPAGLPPGDYDFTYTVPGNGQCSADAATVRVTIVAGLDAGLNGTLPACTSNNLVDLFTGLQGTPQPGGSWVDLSGTGGVTGQFFNATTVPAGSYVFRYVLSGTANCAADQAEVTVNVVAARNPGTNGSIVVCSNSAPFNLFTQLGGNPQSGGVWTNGGTVPAVYNPQANDPGVFTYTLIGTSPCPNATATVTVGEVPAPIAGVSTTTMVCSNGGTFNMTLLLGPTAQAGSWTFGGNPHSNLFTPGVDLPGVYLYTVQGVSPCGPAIATLTVSVNPAANAGNNATTTICSNGPNFPLFPLLTGGAQSGGTWEFGGQPHDGFFEPGNDLPGDYFYTVDGDAPCGSDVAVVTVFQNERPNAGTPGSIALCAGGASVNLLTVLGGSPSPTGSWTGPAPSTAPFNGLFIPGTTAPGTYTYTVVGTPPCANATSTASVSVSTPPNAGISNTITVCSNNSAFALTDSLEGSPTLNGAWTTPPPVGPSNGVFFPGTSVSGIYTYTVSGIAPCPSAVATLNITVNLAANAGNDANLSVCSTNGSQNLFPLLGNNAQSGGTWTALTTGLVHSGTYNPTVDVSGGFRYKVLGLTGCASDSALVSVTENQSPNAGFNGLVTVCSDDAPFQLVNELNGSPQFNGTWQDPVPASHSGIFLPGVNNGGVYTYTVAGVSPCANAQAQVTVIQNPAPDAGGNGVIAICSSAPAFNLFNVLTGSPDPNGNWTGPSGTAVGSQYTPGSSEPGVYKYRIQGLAPCDPDSATVTVFENAAPNAGISTVAQLCSTSGQVSLLTLLGGTPGPGGEWTFNNEPHGPVFDPAVDLSGAYVYTVLGVPPCANAVAQVQITVVNAPNAGTNGTLAVCVGDNALNVCAGLGGSPDGGGTWSDDDNTGQFSNCTLNATTLTPGAYQFTYTLAALAPCPASSATVTVNVAADLDAGDDASVTVCENELLPLFPALGGTPQSGGSWSDVDGSNALIGDVFNASLVPENTTWRFDYILPATSSCVSDTGRVTVTVQPGPYAGCDGFAAFCQLDAPGGLLGSIPCSPDGGGTWIDPELLPHSGTFVPATDQPGDYRYIVAAVGDCAADTAIVTVQVTVPPNAGTTTSVAICSTDPPVQLFGLLGPNAQTGGTWTDLNNVPFSGIYNPAVDVPNTFRYRVPGQAPCNPDDAFVTVTEPVAANAGGNNSISVCSSEMPFDMTARLTGTPQQGGLWYFGGVEHSLNFNPAEDAGGVYTYVIEGTTPCANDTARLTIDLVPAPNAGASSTVNACATQTAVYLFAALGAGAQAGGVWTDLDESGALDGDVFDPSLAGNGTWRFQYAIQVSAPCVNVSSIVTVIVGSGADAGGDSTLTICGAETEFDLFTALTGEPDPGGNWTAAAGGGEALSPDGLLDASLLPVGGQTAFVYTVEDAGCGDVQATVLITTVAYPDPGTAGPLVLCANDEAILLADSLGGTPQAGGVWTGPGAVANDGTFDPATDPAGAYTYTISGNDLCPDSSAVFVITVNALPNAGNNGSVVLCDTLLAYPLLQGLPGGPDPNGVWVDLNGSGGLNGANLNTTALAPGQFNFSYTVTVQGCERAISTLNVEVVSSPEVIDLTTVCNEQDRTYVVSFTIEGGDHNSLQVLEASGTLSMAAPFTFVSDPVVVSAPFFASVTDGNACGAYLVQASSPCSFDTEVFVPESFSPNGDGVNESFIIPGIQGYPNNSLVIFNRWGTEMFSASGYDNASVVWDGSSPDALLAGSAPTGTYFYVLDLGTGSEPLTGFIQLVR